MRFQKTLQKRYISYDPKTEAFKKQAYRYGLQISQLVDAGLWADVSRVHTSWISFRDSVQSKTSLYAAAVRAYNRGRIQLIGRH